MFQIGTKGTIVITFPFRKTECLLNLTQVQSLKEEEFTERGLKEGQPYNYRVAAENEVGVGEYAELPKAVVPKSQYGKLSHTTMES